MDTKYIHSHQLLESRKNIEIVLYPLKTFVGWTLFANKSNVSPGIATIETKAKLLREHYGLSPEDIVERVNKHLVVSLLNYVDGLKTIKAFLLSAINYNLDRIMSSLSRKENSYPPQSISTYRECGLGSEYTQREEASDLKDDLSFLKGVGIKTQLLHNAKSPTVILRKKKAEPEVRTFADFYDDDDF